MSVFVHSGLVNKGAVGFSSTQGINVFLEFSLAQAPSKLSQEVRLLALPGAALESAVPICVQTSHGQLSIPLRVCWLRVVLICDMIRVNVVLSMINHQMIVTIMGK